MLKRALEIVRREGLGSLVARGLTRFGIFRRLVIVGGRDDRRPPPPDLPLAYSRVGVEQLAELLAYRPDQGADELRARFAAGHWCFGARHAGRLVASVWGCRERATIDYLDAEIELADDTIYVYDMYVPSDLRGHALATAIEDYRREALEAAGYRRIVAFILPQNRSAWRHSLRRNDDELGDIRYWRLGPLRWHSLRIRQSKSGPMITRVSRLR